MNLVTIKLILNTKRNRDNKHYSCSKFLNRNLVYRSINLNLKLKSHLYKHSKPTIWKQTYFLRVKRIQNRSSNPTSYRSMETILIKPATFSLNVSLKKKNIALWRRFKTFKISGMAHQLDSLYYQPVWLFLSYQCFYTIIYL